MAALPATRIFGRAIRGIARWWRPLLGGGAATAVAFAALVGWARFGPLPDGLLAADAKPSIVVTDRHGEPLYEVRSSVGTRGGALDPHTLPPTMVVATIAAEDIRFHTHWGLDPIAILRAAAHDLLARRVVEGGSTITQQVAKLLLARARGGTMRRGWVEKAEEAVLALRLEHRLSKDAILAWYLTLAPYGNQIEGAARASRAYFGRDVATLTPAEAAFLAALPQQPSRYNPWRDPRAARARAAYILATMARRGSLTGRDYAMARTEQLTLRQEAADSIAPHFVAHVLAEGGSTATRRIDTTLDAGLERTVRGIIAARRPVLEAHHAENVAVAVLDNRTGDWLAWDGSGNYFDEAHGGTIDGVVSPRQPGSALKPFTYAAAFERGADPATLLPDVPSQFPTAEPGILYAPRNYDGQFRGPLLAREALAGSENVPAVAVLSSVGVPALSRLLRRTGFTSLGENADHYGLGLTLGDAEVRLDELVAGYAMFARGGEYLRPHAIAAVDGSAAPRASPERMVSARTAFWITDILADADARAYIFGRGGSLEFPFTVAAKTGTSTAYHDNWAVGYTREVTVGVWVGNFDRTPLRDSSGVTGAGPIFHDVMNAAVEWARGALPVGDLSPILAPTGDLRRTRVCGLTGASAGEACPTHVDEWLPANEVRPWCTWHHASDEGVVTLWPDVFRTWARTAGLLTDGPTALAPASDTGPSHPSAAAGRQEGRSPQTGLTIVSPLGGGTYLFDPTLRREFQTLRLRASGASGRLDWFVDGEPIGTSEDDSGLRWPLAPGRHAISVRDPAGRTARTDIVVR